MTPKPPNCQLPAQISKQQLVALAEAVGQVMSDVGWTNCCVAGSVILHDLLKQVRWRHCGAGATNSMPQPEMAPGRSEALLSACTGLGR